MHLGRNGIRVLLTKPSHSSDPSAPHSPLASLLRGIVAPKRCLSWCLDSQNAIGMLRAAA